MSLDSGALNDLIADSPALTYQLLTRLQAGSDVLLREFGAEVWRIRDTLVEDGLLLGPFERCQKFRSSLRGASPDRLSPNPDGKGLPN
jgi:hypothetical protein